MKGRPTGIRPLLSRDKGVLERRSWSRWVRRPFAIQYPASIAEDTNLVDHGRVTRILWAGFRVILLYHDAGRLAHPTYLRTSTRLMRSR